ncbi:hypothetical protein F5887DRAFT_1285877 [Amanita rubescens]|nr:hypothetical protein F5887DRAFT_1285877 [Amanita rubescens]
MSESVTTVHFQIQSLQTLEHLLEYPSGGIRVKTTLDRAFHPFTIVPPPSPRQTTTCVIRGRDGLYIRPGPANQHIVWGKEHYEWQVAPIGGNYQIYPAGKDLYWYQSTHTKPYVGLAPGKDLIEEEPVFRLTPLHM